MKISEKTLTLHLYRKDETLAAMRWAIVTRNLSETIYWGIELYDSDMIQEAIKMLYSIWLTQIGIGSWSYVLGLNKLNKEETIDRDTWINTLISFARVKHHDSTILNLLIRGATTPVNWEPRFPHAADYNTIEEAFANTLTRGKSIESWLLARSIDTNKKWEILEKIASQKNRNTSIQQLRSSLLSSTEQLAAACVIICIDNVLWATANQPLDTREIPLEIQQALDEWDSEQSIKKRRVYSIRPEALPYICERAELSNLRSYESQIQDGLLENLLESPCWNSILADYMENGTWKSDTYHEMFYSTYFPSVTDDIPDEWSAKEREKSHGRGIGRSSELNLNRFINTIFQRSTSRGIWNSTCSIDSLRTMEWDTTYNEIQDRCDNSLTSKLPLRAIQKRFEILT